MQADETQRIGDYEILGTLGAGGMGRVYRVRHVISDRIEAMKILLPDLAGRKELADRFLREIKLVASLSHPNIASLCTALTVENQLIMVMEFIDGITLSDLLARGAIPVPEALNYLDQALAALGYAHSRGIIHRDIKPANMMLMPNGTLKLMDFGIARASTERALTQTGTTLGSIDYMSPEQIMGQPVDARSDIYSIGVTLYEMVTGQRPFNGSSDFELMAAHVNQAPRPVLELEPWLPAELNATIMCAIAKRPADRYPTVESLRHALSNVGQGMPITGVETSRAATMIEMRAGTVVESRSATIVRNAEPVGRGMTQVAGAPYTASAAIAVRQPLFARHRKLLLGCSTALVLVTVATPIYLAERPKTDDKPTPVIKPTPPNNGSRDGSHGITPPPPKPTPPISPPQHHVAAAARPVAQVGLTAKQTVTTPPPGEAKMDTPAPPDPAVKQRLDNAEIQIDNLESRATAVNNSLNNMQRSMAKDGMSLRGDMVATQSSMNTSLAKAKHAFADHDADRAERFAALTEPDVKTLESFLGR